MKKKLIAITLIMVILGTFFGGCSIFVKDDYRDSQQAISTITYKGLTETVTKGELSEYYASNGYIYVQYYGMTVEEVMELFRESLSNTKLNLLRARVEVATKYGLEVNLPAYDLLNNAEKKKAVEDTNKQFKEAYDNLYNEVVEEKKLAEGKTEEEEEEEEEEDEHDHGALLEPRTTKTKEEVKFNPDEAVTADQIPAKFLDSFVAPDANGKEALRRLKNNLKKSNRDYEYYFNNQCESLLLDKFKREIIEAGIIITDAEIDTRYNEIKAKEIISYANNKDAYVAKITESNKETVYANYGRYGYVQQILIQFSDEQKAAISAYDERVTEDKYVDMFRKNTVKDLVTNISNPEYSAEAECTGFEKDAEGNATTVKYDVTKDEHPIDHNCSDDRCNRRPYFEGAEFRDVNYSKILKDISTDLAAATTTAEKLAAFDKWIYKVNDDTGMFNKPTGYIIPFEGDHTYVEPFAALGRLLFSKGVGAYTVTKQEADALNNKQVYFDEESGLTYCISEYGIHIMIINGFNYSEDTTVTDNNTKFVSLLNIVDYANNKTLKDVIREKLLTEKKADMYSYDNLQFNTANKSGIVYNERLYKKYIKDISEATA